MVKAFEPTYYALKTKNIHPIITQTNWLHDKLISEYEDLTAYFDLIVE
jgi:hypothetical protein